MKNSPSCSPVTPNAQESEAKREGKRPVANLRSALLSAALLGLVSLSAIACEVTTCDDDECFDDGGENGGAAGESNGSGGTGGGDTGGTGGGAGSTFAEVDCHENGSVEGTLGSTEPDVPMSDDDYECQACADRVCADELAKCYAYGPNSVCTSGTTSLMDGGGETSCMLNCFLELGEDFVAGDQDVDECAAQCGSLECEGDSASAVTQDLMRCLLDTSGENPTEFGCNEECGLIDPT